jgi:hypothetical protein
MLRVWFRVLLCLILTVIFGSRIEAAEPVRLAVSEKMGLTVFANVDNSGQWCRPKLGVSLLLKDDSPLLAQGFDALMPQLGGTFVEKCPQAVAANVAAYKDSDRSLVGASFTAEKANNWARPSSSPQATAATGSPAAPAIVSTPAPVVPTTQCDKASAYADFFVAACTVHGYEARRISEGIDALRSKRDTAQQALQCTPQAFAKIDNIASQSAWRILSSGDISPLMDFTDAMSIECKKAAANALK